jgi:cobalt/nickel transport system permease protein
MLDSLLKSLAEVRYLEDFSAEKSFVHRVDVRVKLALGLAISLAVAGVSRFDMARLLLLALYPCMLWVLSGYSSARLMRQLFLLSLFVLTLGLGELVWFFYLHGFTFDSVLFSIYALLTLLLRFVVLAVSLVLTVATISIPDLAAALAWYRLPRFFVLLLVMIYRYFFVISEDILKAFCALSLRHPRSMKYSFSLLGNLVGALLLRSSFRAQRVQEANDVRGAGRVVSVTGSVSFCDFAILSFWVAYFGVVVFWVAS